jgi:hypothetical protein
MTFGLSLIIFFLAIIALVAEGILYMTMGLGAAFSGNESTLSGIAYFFVSLMVITAAIGILAPIGAVIELATKKKNTGIRIMLPVLSVIICGLIFFGVKDTSKKETFQNTTLSSMPVQESKQSKASSILPTVNAERAYQLSIKLENVQVSEGYGQFDVPGYSPAKPVVKASLRNTGTRTLKIVGVTIYFLDSQGRRIAEKEYLPVNGQRLMGDDSALKPNYVRDFGYIVEDVAPSEWAKKVELAVTRIEFAGSEEEATKTAYFTAIRQRIQDRAVKSQALSGLAKGTIQICTTINRDGSIKDVTAQGTTGSEALKQEAIRIVTEAGPFGQFPDTILETEIPICLPIEFTFDGT